MRQKIVEILERARWAPSGDNSQPWRFEIIADSDLRVHLSYQADNVYEFGGGRPVWIAAGALIENISLVANARNITVEMKTISGFQDGSGAIDLHFSVMSQVIPDPLEACIERRSVNRRAYALRDISVEIEEEMQKIINDVGFDIHWYRNISEKFKIININALATKIRLSIPEAYKVHRKMIDWENDRSEDKMPAKSLGMSSLTLAMTGWAIKSWRRVSFITKYMGGALISSFRMDVVPGLCCARHFVIFAKKDYMKTGDVPWIELGRSIQRLWLYATYCGIDMQPGVAPIVFASHAQSGYAFTKDKVALHRAGELAVAIKSLSEDEGQSVVFAGRIGYALGNRDSQRIRSIRRPLAKSLVS